MRSASTRRVTRARGGRRRAPLAAHRRDDRLARGRAHTRAGVRPVRIAVGGDCEQRRLRRRALGALPLLALLRSDAPATEAGGLDWRGPAHIARPRARPAASHVHRGERAGDRRFIQAPRAPRRAQCRARRRLHLLHRRRPRRCDRHAPHTPTPPLATASPRGSDLPRVAPCRRCARPLRLQPRARRRRQRLPHLRTGPPAATHARVFSRGRLATRPHNDSSLCADPFWAGRRCVNLQWTAST